MRSEVIRCDICKREHDMKYKLPREWITTTQLNRNADEEEHHFCGKPCLAAWATGTAMSAGDQVMFGSTNPLLERPLNPALDIAREQRVRGAMSNKTERA